MKSTFRILCVTLCCVLTVCCCGCHKGGKGSRSGLVPAAGVVMYKGEPVAGATIEMRPSSPDQINSVAVGLTDPNGKFILMTDRPNDGAFPGKYKTVVKKQVEMIDGMTREEHDNKLRDEGKGNDLYFDKSKVKVENLVPVKYSEPDATPLEIEIPAKGNKNITITLED
ncbi:MAG: hypothetical protein IJL92_09315 [Thermoguttaceae bacterium]|nr:hypothetical protein [Thermoguttaceae bacterium]